MSEQEVLQSLRKAIERDKTYFVKAKIDENLDPIRSQVDRLLAELQQKAKIKAGQDILKAVSQEKRMREWFKSKFSDENTRDKYASACDNILHAIRKFRRHSYFDYLEALELIEEVKDDFETAQMSIRDNLNCSKRRIKECNAKHEKVNTLFFIVKLGIAFYLIGLLIALIYDVSIFGVVFGLSIGIIILSLFYPAIVEFLLEAPEDSSLLMLLIVYPLMIFLSILLNPFILGTSIFIILAGSTLPLLTLLSWVGYLLIYLVAPIYRGGYGIKGLFEVEGIYGYEDRDLFYSGLKKEKKETKKEIESLRHRISVAEKSIVPLTAKG